MSRSLSQAAVIIGIGPMSSISPVKIQFSLNYSDSPATLTFSRTWLVPRLFLKLLSGQMSLLKMTLLVTDEKKACEDLLLGIPVLTHLAIDSCRLLERQ